MIVGSSKCRGVVHIRGEEIQDSRYTITMKLSCIQLDKKKLFGKVRRYICITMP